MSNSKASINVSLGIPWFTFWIFTIAFAHLDFGQGVAALFLWPYYLGSVLSTLAGVKP